MVLASQMGANALTMYDKCKSSDNLIDVITITLMPWVFLFGVVYSVILFAGPSISEGLKSPFSNVIGYLIVSGEANDILSQLLVDSEVSSSIYENRVKDEEKRNLEKTSQVILKIMGNMAILINEITPSNFEAYWKTMIPLMREQPKDIDNNNNNNDVENPLKSKLLVVVNRRDAVGELFWLLYTGVLCVALCDYQINTLKCSKNAKQLQLSYNDYLAEKKEINKMVSK